MPRTAVNGQGDVVIFNDATGAWDPARTAQNAQGDKVYFDGSAWQALPGAAAGGDARPAAAAQPSSPSAPAAAPAAPRDTLQPGESVWHGAARQMGQDILDTAQGGLGTAGKGIEDIGQGRLRGAAELPLGLFQYLGSPLAPIMRPGMDLAEPYVQSTYEGLKPTVGETGARLAQGVVQGLAQLPYAAALDPAALTPRAPIRSLPHNFDLSRLSGERVPMPPQREVGNFGPLEGEILSPGTGQKTTARNEMMTAFDENGQPYNSDGWDNVDFNDPMFNEWAKEDAVRQDKWDERRMRSQNEFWRAMGEKQDKFPGVLPPEREVGDFGPVDQTVPQQPRTAEPEAPTSSPLGLAADRRLSGERVPDVPDEPVDAPNPYKFHNRGGPAYQQPANDASREGLSEGPMSWAGEAPSVNRIPIREEPPASNDTRFGVVGEPYRLNSGFDAVRAFQQLVAPETLSADSRAANSAIREQIGLGERDTAVVADQLEPHFRRINNMNPQERYDFFRYMQNRSKGFPINDPTLQGMADVARNAFLDAENKLRALPSTSQMAFRQDYFPQVWRDPAKAQQFFGSRQGSGGFTKGRTFNDIDEGIAAGLELKTDNPIEMTMNYVQNANRFIALNAVRDDAVSNGYIRYIQDPRRVPDDWVKINGRLGQKYGPAGPIQGYAPKDFAQIWNNFVSQGVQAAGEPWANIYQGALHAKNIVQAMEFGFSGYHALTVGMKAPIAELARAMNSAMRGKLLTAGKALANAPVSPVSLVRTGMRARDVAMGRITGTPIERQVVDNLTRGNWRWQGLDRGGEYDYSPMRNYWTSWKRGALKGEFTHDLQAVRDSWGLKAPQMILRHVGRIMQTVAAPLFEKYIPLLKNGAAFKQMQSWMERNPTATREQILQASREIGDQLDNMMGEMNHDNIAWPRIQKQLAQLSQTSFSFTFGNLRWPLGAVTDIPKIFSRGEMPLRLATIIAYPIVLGTVAAVAQKFMTGQWPSEMKDFITPRTGGVTQYGRGRHTSAAPERLMIPGSHKDWMGYYHDMWGELQNKLPRAFHIAAELATNKDWRDKNITTPGQDWTNPQWLQDYFNHAASELAPISVQSMYPERPQPRSAIGPGMRMLGFREPGRWWQDPQGSEAQQKYFDLKNEPASRVQRMRGGRLRLLTPTEQEHRRQYKGPVE